MRYPAIAPVLMLAASAAACDGGPTEPEAEETECVVPDGLFPHPPVPGAPLPCEDR